jgi:hypothetical protein
VHDYILQGDLLVPEPRSNDRSGAHGGRRTLVSRYQVVTGPWIREVIMKTRTKIVFEQYSWAGGLDLVGVEEPSRCRVGEAGFYLNQ